MRRLAFAALVLGCGVVPRGQPPPVAQVPAPPPAPPKVICRPCGEVPPPRGFFCFGKVMIAESVATADAPKVAATCPSPKEAPPGNDPSPPKPTPPTPPR